MWADQDGLNDLKPSKDASRSKYNGILTSNPVERGSNYEASSATFNNTKTVYVYDSNFTVGSAVGRDPGTLVPFEA